MHLYQQRIYVEDTDLSGYVFHGRYLAYAERARTEWLRELGYDHWAVLQARQLYWVVRRAALDYRAPSHVDELLEVTSYVTHIGKAQLKVVQQFAVQDQVRCQVQIQLALVTHAGRPAPLPKDLVALLTPHLRQEGESL